MKLLVVTEYSPTRGSGYTTITHGLLTELGGRGHELVVLGFDYTGEAHGLNAAVITCDMRTFSQQALVTRAGFQPDAIVVIFDLTLQHACRFLQGSYEVPYVGIFPVESDPLVHPSDWTNTIDTMDASLCESRFGTKLLNDAGIGTRYFPVGVSEFWRPPSPSERGEARERYNVVERFVVLTVCDNHERKNLPTHFAAMSLLSGKDIFWPPEVGKNRRIASRKVVPNVYYIVNTKLRGRSAGYNTAALTDRFQLQDRTLVMEHGVGQGLTPEELRDLYWSSDAFLLLSKAEGLGLPVLEAQACGLPVVGTACTGILENIGGGRGYLVYPEFVHIDPFHNQHRRWADPLEAAEQLSRIARRRDHSLVRRALAHAQSFTWSRSADVLEEVLHELASATPPAAEGSQEEQSATAVS